MNLGLLGSGEFTAAAESLDRWLLEKSASQSGRVLIVPTASSPEGEHVFERWMQMGVGYYRRLGAEPVEVPLRNRADASDTSLVELIDTAQSIFFSGGNPGYLVRTFRDTPFWDRLVSAVNDGVSLGGCSAGAVFIGALAPDVTSSDADDLNSVRNVSWLPGLALLPDVFIGAHWDMLDTYVPGLTSLVRASQPAGTVLVGIDEDTGIAGDGRAWKVMGQKSVTVSGKGSEAVYRPGDEFSL